MTPNVLVALNAKYQHTAFGLRCLLAKLGPLGSRAVLREFTIHDEAAQIVAAILADRPKIVDLSVFVWSVTFRAWV